MKIPFFCKEPATKNAEYVFTALTMLYTYIIVVWDF